MDGFIFVGTNFRGLNENDTFVAIVFSFIVYTEKHLFVGTGIRGSDPPRKPRKLVPHEIKPFKVNYWQLALELLQNCCVPFSNRLGVF